MPKRIHKIVLDSNKSTPLFEINKLDSLHLEVEVTEVETLENAEVELFFKKSDGTLVSEIISEKEQNILKIDVKNGALDVPGIVVGQAKITEEDGNISSHMFKFNIKNSITSDDAIVNEIGIGAIEELKKQIDNAQIDPEVLKNKIEETINNGDLDVVSKEELQEINSQLDKKVQYLGDETIASNDKGLLTTLLTSNYDNKYDKNIMTDGYFQNADGSVVKSSQHTIGQLTNAENIKTIIIKNPTSSSFRLSEYDKDGIFIKRNSKSGTELIVELGESTKYIRFGCNLPAKNTVRMYYIYKREGIENNGEMYYEINTPSLSNKSINVEQYEFKDDFTKTKYWITYIPRIDSEGNINELKLGFANNRIVGGVFPETTRSFALRNNATVCINAGVSWESYRGATYKDELEQKCYRMHGLRVYDHMLVSNDIESNWYKKTHWALGIKEDGTLCSFCTQDENGDTTMSYEESQEKDCKYVTSAFTPIMLNGESQKDVLQYKNQWTNDDGSNIYYQRQIIGQNTTTKDIFILTSNGKGTQKNAEGLVIDAGIPIDNCIEILKNFGADFAYQLDEGGSTSLIYKGIRINDVSDDSGKTERLLSDFLYVESKTLTDRDLDIINLRKELGELKASLGNLKKIWLDGESDATREIQRWVNNKLTHSLNLKSSAIQYYDSVNKKTLFQADSSGFLTTILGNYGYFPKELKPISSETFPNYNTAFIYPSTIANAPFSVDAFTLHLTTGNTKHMQIAFAENLETPKFRIRIKNGDDFIWTDWKIFSS